MLNRIILQGRLTADPELRQTPAGVSVASFALAVDRDFKNKESGEKETDFINCVAWRGTGEFVSRYFTKGSLAVVEGRLQMRRYTDRDGNKRIAAEVVADNVYFGGSKKDSEGGAYGQAPAAYSTGSSGYAAAPGADQFAELSDDDGDLPF
ncbi:MAG: Single-stranded D-binding protein [Oscillospiraceae bacterium]|nr:Single-stranded D-binding protein [Oscillospiraceae bacterium]